MMKALTIPLFLAVLLVSGCLSVSPEALIASSPVVQEFLSDYPNAEIKATFYSEAEAAQMLDTIKVDCEKEVVVAKDYYKITITDAESGLSLTAWLDWDRQIVECAVKKGSSGEKIEKYEKEEFEKGEKKKECNAYNKTACHSGHVYMFDACGNKLGKVHYCEHGCHDSACKVVDEEEHYDKKCHDGHVYLFDSDGNKLKKYAYCEHGCEDGDCVKEDAEECNAYNKTACHSGHVYMFDACGNKLGKVHYCENGCDDGECKEDDDLNKSACGESDNGFDIYNKGVCETWDQRLEDHCNDDGTLTEKYCEDGEITWKSVNCPSGYVCDDGACVVGYECTDSDENSAYSDGLNYFEKGVATYSEKGVVLKTEEDYCGTEGVEEGYLREHYCSASTLKSKLYNCQYGCADGACVSEEDCVENVSFDCHGGDVYAFDSCGTAKYVVTECENGCEGGECINETSGQECIDQDGVDEFTYGEVWFEGNTGPSIIDVCSSDSYVAEGICTEAGGATTSAILCDYGCVEGACLMEPVNESV